MSGKHNVRFEYCDDDTADAMGDDAAWRATAVNPDDVEIAEAFGRDPLGAACRLASLLADENEERAAYLPDDYVDLAYRT